MREVTQRDGKVEFPVTEMSALGRALISAFRQSTWRRALQMDLEFENQCLLIHPEEGRGSPRSGQEHDGGQDGPTDAGFRRTPAPAPAEPLRAMWICAFVSISLLAEAAWR